MSTVSERLPAPMCPVCGQPAQATTTRYGKRHACCGLWSWGGKPLTDGATHAARITAHDVFDALWRGPTKVTRRSHAYKLLRCELDIEEDECHMAQMDLATASRVPAAVERIRARLGQEQS